MNDDLHALFKSEAEDLRIGPPPTIVQRASVRRRRRARRGALVAAGVAVVALAGGYAFVATGNPEEGRTADDPTIDPTQPASTAASQPTASGDSSHHSPMPTRLPDCGAEPITIRTLDWVTHIAPTAREAAESLLGKSLTDADIDAVTPIRRDVVVPDSSGGTVAVVSVYRTEDGLWNAVEIYDCGTIVLPD